MEDKTTSTVSSDITSHWKIKIILWPTATTHKSSFEKLCGHIIRTSRKVYISDLPISVQDNTLSSLTSSPHWKSSSLQFQIFPHDAPPVDWDHLYVHRNVFGSIAIHSPLESSDSSSNGDNRLNKSDEITSTSELDFNELSTQSLYDNHPCILIKKCFFFKLGSDQRSAIRDLSDLVTIIQSDETKPDLVELIKTAYSTFALQLLRKISTVYSNPRVLFSTPSTKLDYNKDEQVDKPSKNYQGRLTKMKADILVLCGDPLNALTAYSAAIEAAKYANDHVWNACSIEGQVAACFQYLVNIEADFQQNFKRAQYVTPPQIELLINSITPRVTLNTIMNSNNTNISQEKLVSNHSGNITHTNIYESQKYAIMNLIFNKMREVLFILNQDVATQDLFFISLAKYCRFIINYMDEPSRSNTLTEIFETVEDSNNNIKIQFFTQLSAIYQSLGNFRKFSFYLSKVGSIYKKMGMFESAHFIFSLIAPWYHLSFLKLPPLKATDHDNIDKTDNITTSTPNNTNMSESVNEITGQTHFGTYLKQFLANHLSDLVEQPTLISPDVNGLTNDLGEYRSISKLALHAWRYCYQSSKVNQYWPTLQNKILTKLYKSADHMNDKTRVSWYTFASLIILHPQMDAREQASLANKIDQSTFHSFGFVELPVSLFLLSKSGHFKSDVLKNVDNKSFVLSNQKSPIIYLGGICSGQYTMIPIFKSITPFIYNNTDSNKSIIIPNSLAAFEADPFRAYRENAIHGMLFNPYDRNIKKDDEKLSFIWVVYENYSIKLNLYNPLQIRINLENLSLITHGVELETQPLNVTLQPQKETEIFIPVTPKQTGEAFILGVYFNIFKFHSQYLLFEGSQPILDLILNYADNTSSFDHIETLALRSGSLIPLEIISPLPLANFKIIYVDHDLKSELYKNLERVLLKNNINQIILLAIDLKTVHLLDNLSIDTLRNNLDEDDPINQNSISLYTSQDMIREIFNDTAIKQYNLIAPSECRNITPSETYHIPIQVFNHKLQENLKLKIRYTSQGGTNFTRQVLLEVYSNSIILQPKSTRSHYHSLDCLFDKSEVFNTLIKIPGYSNQFKNEIIQKVLKENSTKKIHEMSDESHNISLISNGESHYPSFPIYHHRSQRLPIKNMDKYPNFSKLEFSIDSQKICINFKIEEIRKNSNSKLENTNNNDSNKILENTKIFTTTDLRFEANIESEKYPGPSTIFITPISYDKDVYNLSEYFSGSLEKHITHNERYHIKHTDPMSPQTNSRLNNDTLYKKKGMKIQNFPNSHSVVINLPLNALNPIAFGIYLWKFEKVFWHPYPFYILSS